MKIQNRGEEDKIQKQLASQQRIRKQKRIHWHAKPPLLMRVYVNSSSSPLLRLEQYSFKQHCAAPLTSQVLLRRKNLFVASQSLTQKHTTLMGGVMHCK